MTVQERIQDISKRCGMSEDIIRRVLQAEQQSVLDSLKRGERATLIGRCAIVPELRSRLSEGCTLKSEIRLTATVAHALASELEGMDKFIEDDKKDDTEIPKGVMLMQLPSLT